MREEQVKKAPVITLPENEEWVGLLKEKLEYYEIRSKEQHRSHPELIAITDVGYKIRVLSTLLEQGEIPTWDLSGKFAEEDDGRFVTVNFQNACAVIAKYSKDRDFLTEHVQKDRIKYGWLGHQ